MKIKSILLSSLLLIANLFYFSCAGKIDTPVIDTSEPKEPTINNPIVEQYFLTEQNVKLLGRSYFLGDYLWMPYSSTGAEFHIKAKRLDVTFAGDSGVRNTDENSAARVVVFVDGERKLDELIFKNKVTFTIFDETTPIEGTVQILKVSEVANSTAAIESISLDPEGSFTPTSSKDLKIEFIGDSITCGYGVDDLNRNNHFKTSTEDNTKTYAYKTAKSLDADYSMVSISGWGIISGYTGNDEKNSSSQLPRYYDKLGFSWGNNFMGTKPQSINWDFAKFQPDYIVVNLGTNDASYTKGIAERIEEYSNAYVEFLKDIRSKNENAHIICALGIMGQDLYPAIETAVADYSSQTGDTNLSTLKFPTQNMSDGIAADWHPSEKTHTKAAAILIDAINKLEN